jgi:PAS domain S-box-containing protein
MQEPPDQVPDGHVPNGHLPNGHVPNGHVPKGHLPNGHVPNELLHQSERTRVSRGRHPGEDRTLIIKQLRPRAATPAAIARLGHEWELGRELSGTVVRAALGRARIDGQHALLLEDPGGEPLRAIIDRDDTGLGQRLELALALARAVAELHAMGISHRAIGPDHLLVTPGSNRIHLIDTGLATLAPHAPQDPIHPRDLPIDPVYAAPEQTGRLGRAPDRRLDLYSLGVTLFELFAGRPPFTGEDPLELFEQHIGRPAPSLLESASGSPTALARIIARLLEKRPEDRYQDAGPLAGDLEQVLQAHRGGRSSADLTPSSNRPAARFATPSGLYGRDRERRSLNASLEQARIGQSALVLLSGPEGVGKHELVRICISRASDMGFFSLTASPGREDGSMEQHPVISAFAPIVRWIRGLEEPERSRWQGRLQREGAEVASVLSDALPDLRHLLPPGAPPAVLPPIEHEQRFAIAFLGLARALASPELPLLLVIPDCDQLDEDACRLLSLLAGRNGIRHLQILAITTDPDRARACLADPLDPDRLHGIEVPPLDVAETRALVADALLTTPTVVHYLGERIHRHARGLPARVLGTLEALRDREHLVYDPEVRHWYWDEDAIAGDLIREDPTSKLRHRLERTPAGTLACLEAAAAIGDAFDVRMLGEVLEQPVPEILRQLCPALETGLIEPTRITAGDGSSGPDADHGETPLWRLRFTSAEIRNAVHEQLDERRRAELHLRIGRHLVEGAGDGDEAALREGVAQLDLAWRMGETANPDGPELARLNLLAGRSALGIARARSAYQYLRTGLGLLGANAWQEAGELALALTVAAMEAATLCGDPGQVERLGRAALERTPDPESRMRITALMARMLFAEGRDEEARSIALPVLDAAGLAPRNLLSGPLGLVTTLIRSRQLLRRLERPGADRRRSADATLILGTELLMDLAQGSFRSEAPAFPGALRRLLRTAASYRGIPESIHALACTGALCARLGLREDAIRHRSAVERALDGPESAEQPRARVRARFILLARLLPWLEPPSKLITPLLDLYREALTIGDVDTAAHAASEFALLRVFQGGDIGSLRRELSAMETALGAFRRTPGGELLRLQGGFLDALSGAGDPATLDRMRADLGADTPATLRWYGDLLRGWLALLDGRPADSLALLESPAARGPGNTPGHAGSQHQLILALAHLDRARATTGGIRRHHRRIARRARLRLEAWTGHGLTQVRQRVLLVRAEEAALGGHEARALDRFERAIHAARTGGFGQDEALAWQRAARLCRDTGRVELADRMEDGAREAWSACGAGRILAQLAGTGPVERPGSPSASESGPDLASLLAGARTLAGEPDLPALATELVERALVLAGGRRAVLVLVDGDRLELAASVETGAAARVCVPPEMLDGARDRLPVSMLRAVVRSRAPLVVDGSTEHFDEEPWMLRQRPGAILCMPLPPTGSASSFSSLTGVLYLEHVDTIEAFTGPVVEGVGLLAVQTATAIDNVRLREALAQARAEFRGLFENAAEGIFRASLDGRLLLANDALAEALGHVGAESLTAAVARLRDLVADPEQADRISADLRARGTLRNRELEALRRDGSRVWLELSARTVRDEDGRPRAIEGSIIDVTARRERRQAEQAREVAEAATRAKTDFLASMSHEIRTPMNAIVGFADLALSTELSSRQREYVGNIHDAADALLGIINDILDLSRIEAGRMELVSEPLDPAHLFRQLEALFGTRARTRGTRLQFEGGDRVAAALPAGRVPCGDPVRLRQVLVNLVDNALKFTPDGEVRVSVHCIEASTTRARLDFRVRDDGPGIPASEQERLFGSFEQLDAGITRQHAGTGLGLAISRQLVELMGSRLELASASGTGSSFGFELDLPMTPARPATAPVAGIPDGALAGRHLLLAEDNRINQQLALEFLQSAGARVTVTETGTAVLEQVATTRFDAILMDLHMPGLDGIEACRRLRRLEFGRTTPVIAVTADAVGDSVLRAREAGFDGHVLKPVSRATLIGTLLRFLPPAEEPAPIQDALLPADPVPPCPAWTCGSPCTTTTAAGTC